MSSYNVTCSSCGTTNRIPADKQGRAGRCGSCRAALLPMYYQPQSLNERTFDGFIQGYPGPVLAEFWAPTWPHCITFAPAVRKAAELLAGRVAVIQVNTQENPHLAGRFNVRGIPVVYLLQKGRVVDQLAGAQSLEALVSWFKRKL